VISLYTWLTPNGYKVAIMLEELGVPYSVHPVDLGAKEQLRPAFLALSPNNKVPAIVDDEAGGLSIFESGAILTYLAEKHGRFLPAAGPLRYKALEWLHWHNGGLGPMSQHLVYFLWKWENQLPEGTRRVADELNRLLDVIDRRLADVAYLAGDEYTIADIINYPWTAASVRSFAHVLGDPLRARPNLARWLELVGQRPAVRRGMAVPDRERLQA
jgi:GSH-dependent disulfide-bond oxidoreductase